MYSYYYYKLIYSLLILKLLFLLHNVLNLKKNENYWRKLFRKKKFQLYKYTSFVMYKCYNEWYFILSLNLKISVSECLWLAKNDGNTWLGAIHIHY